MDFLKEIQLQNAPKNGDVAKVEMVGELLVPPGGNIVSPPSSLFVFSGAAQAPASLQLLHVLCPAADFQPRDPESSQNPSC